MIYQLLSLVIVDLLQTLHTVIGQDILSQLCAILCEEQNRPN